MAYHSKRRQMKAEINVVPYIDVMLVLLIIFMVTSPFITQGVDVELPSTSESQSATELAENKDTNATIIVEIDKNGNLGLSLNNAEMVRGMSIKELTAEVQNSLEKYPKAPVYVGGDQSVPYGEIIKIMDQLKVAGVKSVGLLTQPIEEPKP